MQPIDFVEAAWARLGADDHTVGYIGYLDRETGQWREEAFPWDAPELTIRGQEDVFFSANVFNGRRLNKNAVLRRNLFADLDGVDYREIREDLKPTLLWQTSPGNYQALWFLYHREEELPLDEWSLLNQELTYKLRADRGGWHASKMLRIPGLPNWKYYHKWEGVPISHLIDKGPHYKYSTIKKIVRGSVADRVRPTDFDDHPPIPERSEDNFAVGWLWGRLSSRAAFMLQLHRVNDRSMHIVKLIKELKQNTDITADEAWQLIWWRPWNKWRLKNNPHQLWREIMMVYH